MTLTFLEDAEIEVVETFDEETETLGSVLETFRKGEKVEADVLADNGDSVDLQFGDGSCAYGLPKVLFSFNPDEE